MNPPDELMRENETLRERLALMSQASLRINESLDFDTVLQEVLDSARSLTGARYGAITLFDDSGSLMNLLFSGVTEHEAQLFHELPDGIRFLEYLSAVPGPLRVPDLNDHFSAMGLPEFESPIAGAGPISFLLAPILHRGVRAGSFYLAGKEGEREFIQEDEETLALFASQAAMVIANARRHREERRARADLETLINTSPVGVVVLDAATGAPKSLNREALRIADGLRKAGQTPENLMEVVSFRRADGREASLRELPMAELLSSGETVRAEEIVLEVPDGRSVTVLLNATPILSDGGTVESVVVTMQDMADVEELERMRADFLAMVSHELRGPLTSIKGSAATVLGSSADMDPAVVRQFFRIIEEQADHMNELVADLLDVARIETGELPVSPEPAEVAALVDRARSAFSSGRAGNPLEIDVPPDLPLVLADRRRVVQVLGNLLANAARYSPRSSVIRVGAVQEGVHVAFSVTDEGRGIPAEGLPRLFRKFSKVQSEDLGDETGLGLAICKGIVEAHGGRIWAESDGPGRGTRFTFTIPTVAEAGTGPAVSTPSSLRIHQGKPEERVRVLAVDDDPQALRYIRDTLAGAGYQPVVTGDAEEALRLMREERPHLALLDLMLSGADGIDLMQHILGIKDVPVIFLSAYGREELIARAFDMGAVDYVVKPFSPTELGARIRAALRRREAPGTPESYVYGDLVVDIAQRRVTLGDSRVPLVAMEYRMLAELAANAGQVLTYDRLLERVWGEKSGSDLRPMRTIVSKLRRKLNDDADNPTYIFTEPRVGYWMPRGDAPGEEPPASS